MSALPSRSPAREPVPPVTEKLARFVLETPSSAIPAEAFEKSQKAVVDTAACVMAGAASEEAEPLLHYLEHAAAGPVPILGTARTADAAVAAMVNGTFGHALDYDDVLSIMPAHPSTVVLPALLSLAPSGTSGRALLEAHIIGVEVGAKIGIAIGNGHYQRGWHATGTLAIFSAVAGLGRLLSLDVTVLRRAFGIAASMASGLHVNFGTMTKPFHAGWASHNAVVAVRLAQAGMTASLDAFEAVPGFFSTYGAENSDVGRVLEGLGAPFAVLDPGIALKAYPCCYALHRQIDAMLILREKLGLNPGNVAEIASHAAPGAYRPLLYTDPKTGLEAKFSVEYVLAAGVLDGRFGLVGFGDEAVKRPEIKALLPRTRREEEQRCFGDDPKGAERSAGTRGFVEVKVTMTDGRSETVRIDKPKGSPQKELTWDDIAVKFADCAETVGKSEAEGARAFELWRGLKDLGDIAPAVRALTKGAA